MKMTSLYTGMYSNVIDIFLKSNMIINPNYFMIMHFLNFSLPKDKIIHEKWILNINRDYIFNPSCYTRICCKHFNDDYFLKTDQLRRFKVDIIPKKMMGVHCSLLSSNIYLHILFIYNSIFVVISF